MLMINKSGTDIQCVVDNKSFWLHEEETLEVPKSQHMEVKHCGGSFVCDGTGKSTVLKILRLLDDPFKTKKDYHICVDALYDISSCAEDTEFTILHRSVFADAALQVFYDYFVLNNQEESPLLANVQVPDKENIGRLFAVHNRRQVRWDAVWNILIEPIIFEMIGYVCIYLIFSLWIGTKALWIVGALIAASILWEIILFWRKRRVKDTVKFDALLTEQEIIQRCYLRGDQ